MNVQNRYVLLVTCFAAIACSERTSNSVDSARADSIARSRQDSINRTLPGYVVDSIRPVEEELRRFRRAVGGDSARALTGGATSREQLVRQFIDAVATADTMKLRQMVVTPREFSDLIYPESPNVRPPYLQPPGLVWSEIESSGATGLTRLMRRVGGQKLRYLGHDCVGDAERYGLSRIWKGCTVRVQSTDARIVTGRLFGSIVERDHRFKFLSYANDF
ncbi:MAG: hypothetical protein ABI556_01925 [Gemmatimonadales bacterium]